MTARSSAGKKSGVGSDRHRADHAARHQEAEGMDRIGRVRAQHHVARRGDRLRHVGEAFLGAERRDDLRVGIELHAEAAGVIGGLGAAQAGNAARGRIAVGARLARPSRISLSTMCCGVGRSGLPMPRSMMSAPALRAAGLQRG